MASLPPRLKQRGITEAAWRSLTPAQQKDLVKQSDKLYKQSVRAGTPEERRNYNARRRARRYADKPVDQRTGDNWKDDEEAFFWEAYQEMRVAA